MLFVYIKISKMDFALRDAKVIIDPTTQRPKGYGFVSYPTKEVAHGILFFAFHFRHYFKTLLCNLFYAVYVLLFIVYETFNE